MNKLMIAAIAGLFVSTAVLADESSSAMKPPTSTNAGSAPVAVTKAAKKVKKAAHKVAVKVGEKKDEMKDAMKKDDTKK